MEIKNKIISFLGDSITERKQFISDHGAEYIKEADI